MDFNGLPECNQIDIFQPAKYLLFRVKFDERPIKINTPLLEIFRNTTSLMELMPINQKRLELFDDDNRNMYFQFAEFYPEVGSYYMFSWKAEY